MIVQLYNHMIFSSKLFYSYLKHKEQLKREKTGGGGGIFVNKVNAYLNH